MTRATPIRSIAPDDPDDPGLIEAAAILRAGGLVAFPTETVYGLGADATDPAAVSRIFAAKGRPPTNPLIAHADGIDLARRCVADWPESADSLARRFWPGPLTLVLPRSAMIPDVVTGGGETVGVRVPGGAAARSLIARVGRPLAAPSANRSTGISPTRAEHVSRDLDGRIDLILDAGPTDVGLESTVLDLTADPPRILRPGPIEAGAISDLLGRPVRSGAGDAPPPTRRAASSPGLMAVHYAPRTRAVRVEPGEAVPELPPADRLAILVVGGDRPPMAGLDAGLRVDLPEPVGAARDLYDALHRCDSSHSTLILVGMPPDLPAWAAIRDRLRRATSPAEPGPSARHQS
ncbi:L-threonylcarbamoyladenylate synthase [Tautonia plasticadhaerens]|uniref:Threonylcarbamoyl-AMP synthase n=1 Tax=Tautonia plasticadhaerens TaxID=2527974 RepID=A0A518H782_9BACT|nr:L-threonylcarbamoyladenylate synthase [Tautonia plasticadhaerens]QDV36729.1 Threonylcarbamoyl-AMP synthase [Tautonia plasticadhaerens]